MLAPWYDRGSSNEDWVMAVHPTLLAREVGEGICIGVLSASMVNDLELNFWRHSSHLANWPSRSLKFRNHTSNPWSVAEGTICWPGNA